MNIRMTRNLQIVLHMGVTMLAIYCAAFLQLQPNQMAAVSAMLSTLQNGIGSLFQGYNPDGTPAAEPFEKNTAPPGELK